MKSLFKNIISKLKNHKLGFSLVELIVVIAIMIVLLAILAPSIMHYVERSRTQKDLSAGDEVTNAVMLGMSDKDVYDELLKHSVEGNVSCYVDTNTEANYQAVTSAHKYMFDDDARLLDETPYHPAGSMRGVTITFEPKQKSGANATQYELKDGIINKYVSNEHKVVGEDEHLYSAIRQVIGDKLELTSQTYRNSELTIFINIGTLGGKEASKQDAVEIYSQFSGTNLPADTGIEYTPTIDRVVVVPEETPEENKPSGGGNVIPPEDLGGSGGGSVHTHSYSPSVTEPTCTERGFTKHTCSCGDSYISEDSYIPALGHQWNEGAVAKEASCGVSGIRTYTCSICGTTEGREIAAKQHDYQVSQIINPTCTTSGYTTYTCEYCGHSYNADETSATGHTFDSWTTTKEATCTEDGLKIHKCVNSGCSVNETAKIDKLGHVYINTVVNPTCTEKGYTTHTCTRCNDTYTDNELSSLGHDIEITTIDATCITDGKTIEKCKRDNCTYEKITVTASLGHNLVTDIAKEATCTEDGLTAGQHCDRCGTVLTQQEKINALGHNYKIVESKESTCSEAGYDTYQCQRENCDDHYTISTTLKEHTIEILPAKEATCTGTGLKEGNKCSVCNIILKEQEIIDALGHDIVMDEKIEPTCTEKGLAEGTHCNRCGEILQAQEEIPALGHREEIIPAVEPTCTSPGLSEGKRCSVCGEILVQQEVLPKTDHNYTIVSKKDATCTENGLEIYKCQDENCSDTYEVSTPATGHTLETITDIEPTCTENGLAEGKKCTVCGEIIVAQTEIAALGHNYVTTQTKAACTEDGSKTTTCTRCDYCKTEIIPATGHVDENDDNVCDNCGNTLNITITEDDDGTTDGIVPPSEDEPYVEPTIPEEEIPELIEFELGEFKSDTTYTPGTYEKVEYTVDVVTVKQPVANKCWQYANWLITKDSNDVVINTEPVSPNVKNIDQKLSTYIAYTLDNTNETLQMNGVESHIVQFYEIINDSDDTLDNAIYLAAVAQKEFGYNMHIAQWNGSNYVDLNKDAAIDAIDTFTVTTTITRTQNVEITAPSTSTEYVYVPMSTMKAEKGMTWSEWLASDYNTTGQTSPVIKTSDFEDVDYADIIDSTKSYGFVIYKLSGIWYFNDYPTLTSTGGIQRDMHQAINFTSNGNSYKQMYQGTNGERLIISYCENVSVLPDGYWEVVYADWSEESGEESDKTWYSTSYRTVDFGAIPQQVSKEFYEWFTANAKQYTLSGTWVFNDDLNVKNVNIIQEVECFLSVGNDSYDSYISTFYIGNEACGSENGPFSGSDMHYIAFRLSNAMYPHLGDSFIESAISYIYDQVNINTYEFYWEIYDVVPSFDFGDTPKPVSKEFYEWFTANATSMNLNETKHYDNNNDGYCDGCGESIVSNSTYDANTLVFKSNGVAYLYGDDNKVIKTYTGWDTGTYSSRLDTPWYNERANINTVIIEDGVAPTSTAYWFYGCLSLTSVSIGTDLTKLDKYAFYECKNLTKIYFNATAMEDFDTSQNVTFYMAGRSSVGISLIIGNNVTRIPQCMFSYGSPSTTNGVSCNPNITSITFENESVCTSIGDYAFAYNDNLTAITIPDSVTSIGEKAFSECTRLKNITIGSDVTDIGDGTFEECENITQINFNATKMNNLSNNNGIFSLAGQSQSGIKVIVGSNVTSIPDYLFKSTNSTSSAPNIVTIEFESGSVCKIIGAFAFSHCNKIQSVSLPDSITSIGRNAFQYGTGLTSIYIPSSITKITASDQWASPFFCCSSALKIYCGSSSTKSGWSKYWNYYNSSNTLNTTYGITRQVYESTYK